MLLRRDDHPLRARDYLEVRIPVGELRVYFLERARHAEGPARGLLGYEEYVNVGEYTKHRLSRGSLIPECRTIVDVEGYERAAPLELGHHLDNALARFRSIEKMAQYGDAMSALKSTVLGDMTECDLVDVERTIKAHTTDGPKNEMVR